MAGAGSRISPTSPQRLAITAWRRSTSSAIPTPNWYFMQNVNLQIQKLAPDAAAAYIGRGISLRPVPKSARGPSTNSLVAGVTGDTFLVGDFTHRDGSRYVIVVNKDLAKSHPCFPQFRKSPRHLQHVSPYSGVLTPFEGEHVWLAPGQGVLLKPEW